MRWTVHAEGGPHRVNHAAVHVNGVIFSFGGDIIGLPIDVFVLHTDSYKWHVVPKPGKDDPEVENWPLQRYGHTVAAYDDNIYLFGGIFRGWDDVAPCYLLYCFNTTSYMWTRPKVSGQAPGERHGHTSCIIAHNMYVFGGYDEALSRFSRDVYKLDLNTLMWSLLHCQGDPPIYRDFHSATAIGEQMFIFGGRSSSDLKFHHNKIHYLDTTTFTWYSPSMTNAASHIPEGRRSHSALNLNGKFLVFGGYSGNHNNWKHYNDLWLLDPSTWTWSQGRPSGNGPNARRRQTMCKVGERIFVLGGTSTSPYDGPSIASTDSEMELITDQKGKTYFTIDHNDLFVLDLNPSLKTLCLLYLIKSELSTCDLPHDLHREIGYMSAENTISTVLKTALQV